mmetsp:Transcript_128852/g.325176  ORF Transcript_128852/g.325176 Transcript_128852/m.325176 type:complete len:95 (+) Transcript_128852:1559-1843(+)
MCTRWNRWTISWRHKTVCTLASHVSMVIRQILVGWSPKESYSGAGFICTLAYCLAVWLNSIGSKLVRTCCMEHQSCRWCSLRMHAHFYFHDLFR